jgi:hypothetical protein
MGAAKFVAQGKVRSKWQVPVLAAVWLRTIATSEKNQFFLRVYSGFCGAFAVDMAMSKQREPMNADTKTVLHAILLGGFVAGAADIISALGNQGGRVVGVMQYIASGLIGKIAFDGGALTVALGFLVHFGLTTIMAALFVLAARRWEILWRNPWPMGLAYGALLYVAMFYFIVPILSAAQGWKTPQGFWRNLGAANGHGFFVGVPIACAARYFLGRKAA